MSNQWKMVPADLLDRALLSIMEQGIEVDGQYELVEIQKAPVPPAGDVEVDYPEFHTQGMGCGLEDRGITDRYDAMRHGWDEAIDRCATEVVDPLVEKVTRLTAERDLQNADNERLKVVLSAWADDREAQRANDIRLEAELTKARELLRAVSLCECEDLGAMLKRVDDYVATPIAHNANEICGQDAEAAKGGWCPDCSFGKISQHEQGQWRCGSCDFTAPENDGGLDE